MTIILSILLPDRRLEEVGHERKWAGTVEYQHKANDRIFVTVRAREAAE